MKLENPMDCSSRIKLERQKRSWTQEKLAERARLSARTVQRVECGAEASPETLRLIAEALGVSPETLRPAKPRAQFGAPWARLVKITTAGVLVLFFASAVLSARLMPGPAGGAVFLLLGLIVLSCLVLSVNGFMIRDGRLLVHRLGWATEFDLKELSGWDANPRAMAGSLRLCGNGGVFCFIGWYRNPVLGRYRAYVTDPARAVVLEFGAGKKIVVSPDDPQAFVEALREAVDGICGASAEKLRA